MPTYENELARRDAEISRLQTLLRVSKLMNAGMNHARLLEKINEEVRRYLDADRLTVFFYDSDTEELYSYFASGLQPGEIRIPATQGVAGYVFRSGEMLCLEDAYEDPRFNPEIDRRTGYHTKSLLSLHITNRTGVRIGVVQALNKQSAEGVFTSEDMIFLWEVVDQISDLYAALEEALAHLVMYSADFEGIITYVSPAFESIIGYSPAEAVGHRLSEFVYLDDIDDFEANFHRTMSGVHIEQNEFRVMTKAGKVRWMRSSTRPVMDDDKVSGAQGQMVDISERKQLEEELRQAQKIESIGRLAGGIAHDFNNLLVPIIGYSELAEMKLQDVHPARSDLEQIRDAAERAKELTHQLLAFSRKQVLDMKVLDLTKVLADFEKILRRLIGEDIGIETVVAPALGYVKADRAQVQQILMNLAVNARDAMPDGGKLTISLSNVLLDEQQAAKQPNVRVGAHVLMTVADTGEGMDAETLEQAFEPFFTTKKRGNKGTGLGLATVYGIVKQHDGGISTESQVGKGTTFNIYLPRVETKPDVEAEPTSVSSDKSGGSETVLVVEDEDVVRNFVCEILNNQGYNVLEAMGPDVAMVISEEHEEPIDLLLTDVIMPHMNGRELCRRLTESRPEMKVLYMSGYTDNVIGDHGVLDPGVHFIQKPFSVPGLMQKIRDTIDTLDDKE